MCAASCLALALLCGHVCAAGRRQQTCELATSRMNLAADALRGHFWNETAGVWEQNLWWHQANSLEVIASHAILASGNETLRAQVVADIQRMHTQNSNMSRGGPFLTGYFDDEEWWALGWLRAWELTGEPGCAQAAASPTAAHGRSAARGAARRTGGVLWP